MPEIQIPFWQEIVVGPLTQGLVYLHRTLGNFGLAIIVFTVAIRLLMLPLSIQQLRSSRAMQRLQPLLGELQRKYGRERAKLAEEQMRLYREHGVNPAAGCLPMLVQMPIWFGLYQALFSLSGDSEFAGRFLWIANLGAIGTWTDWWAWPLALFTGATQWVQQKMMTPQSNDPQQQMMASVMNFMPIMFMFFAFSVPHGLVLYWATSNVVSLVQQYFFTGWGGLPWAPAGAVPRPVVATAPPPRAERPAPRRPAPTSTVAPSSDVTSPTGIRTYTLEPEGEEPTRPSGEPALAERRARAPRRKRKR